ncbi:phthalate transporter [Coprinopsis marcescibilis]|uniref:Phthalate transporter n=1 Tax=Coprinopsis marcescibilis TaxID=230819 RepID=A0A5C3KPH9_COPMA|nr:phthalate transporter [Coprinopsis marcescibilis]
MTKSSSLVEDEKKGRPSSESKIVPKTPSDTNVQHSDVKDEETIIESKETLAAKHKKVLRKMDWKLLPFISVLYLLSFLDRANIGNAKIAGMAKDLHLDGLKYNIIAAVFFIPYALAEVPSNICLKLFRPSRWIPTIMIAWGLVMTLMCLVKSYEGLIVARVFLGLTEAGLFPGITFYLSLWYRRRDVAQRYAIFFSAATVAGAFGGLLAFGIEHMEGIGGLYGWQWIFCLEGMATVLFAFLSYFFMYDYPETANFLTEEERRLVVDMLKEDRHGLATEFSMTYVWQAILDRKTYLQVGIYMGLLIPVYAISLFTPTIVNELGFSAAHAQLLTVPPFVCGCIATLIIGMLSDKHNKRGAFVILGCCISMVGYIILLSQSTPAGSYVGAVLAATGVYPCVPVTLAWAGSNAGGDMRRGVALAMVIGMGNLGGICSSFIYIGPPRFFLGHGVILGWLAVAIIFSTIAMWDYKRHNAINIARCQAEGIDESREDEFKHMGNESPLFRYTI